MRVLIEIIETPFWNNNDIIMAKIIKKDNDQKTIIQIQTPKSGVRILLNDDMISNKPVEVHVGYFVENPTMLLKQHL